MLIEAVSNDVVAICLNQLELNSRGLDTALSGNDARKLVVKALKEQGEQPWPEIEVELFTSEHSLLLLARPARQKTCCFSFNTIESIISAVCAYDCAAPSELFYYEGSYLLLIREAPEKLPFTLFEYGDRLHVHASLPVHIREHSNCLISENAIGLIRNTFS